MEGIIAGLLKQFEDGKMTRRHLIQSLALAAAAAPAASLAAAEPAPSRLPGAPAFPPAPWKTVWLDHISYAVADYKKSSEFYQNLMGWEVQNDNGTSQATLKIGDIGGIIIRNRQQPAAAAAAPAANAQPRSDSTRAARPPITGVINHISYGVEPWNTEAVEAELKKRGLNPRPDMVGETFKSFHVRDPDGWDLQISNKTNGR